MRGSGGVLRGRRGVIVDAGRPKGYAHAVLNGGEFEESVHGRSEHESGELR